MSRLKIILIICTFLAIIGAVFIIYFNWLTPAPSALPSFQEIEGERGGKLRIMEVEEW